MTSRKRIAIGVLLGATALVLTATSAWAQDPVKVGPNIYKTLFENERVRVCQATFKPGDTMAFVYVKSGGKLQVGTPDGKSQDLDLKAGDVLWLPAQTHKGKNIGTTDVVLIVNELKEPAPKPAATPATK
ncbi:MAG: cytoplasmic protein [candidate division Zixibacteria bacterium]|nr:cytoplasmic protein [candidate division Zixibacteria bacterium]